MLRCLAYSVKSFTYPTAPEFKEPFGISDMGTVAEAKQKVVEKCVVFIQHCRSGSNWLFAQGNG